MSEYPAGTVAHIRIRDTYEGPAIRTNTGGWAWVPKGREGAFCGISVTAVTSEVRPLVAIDPEDRQQVTTLAASITHAGSWVEVDDAQAALRSLVKPPKPPKPAEPTGLGAVVEDSQGERWVRVAELSKSWRSEHASALVDYALIDAVSVLSDGVQP